MPWLNPLLVVYALLNIVLGIHGAISAKEYYSLSGVAIGLLVLGSIAWAKTQPRWGRIASLVIAALVVARFMPKFLKTQQWYPAGLEVIASIVVIVALLAGHLLANRPKGSATPGA